MARKSKKFTIPVAVIGGFMPLAKTAYEQLKAGGISNLKYVSKRVIPWDSDANGGRGAISFQYLGGGLYPIIAGFMVHWLIGGKLGVNRLLSRAGVPLIRL